MPFSRNSSRISLAAILTLLTGLAVTGLLFVAVSALEYSKMELSFQQRGHMRAAAIRRGMDDALELVTIINTLFRSVGVVDREQFAAFTQPLLERYPFVQAFNFSRVMDHASARRHEADLQRQYPGYAARGQPPAAGARPQHVIIDYGAAGGQRGGLRAGRGGAAGHGARDGRGGRQRPAAHHRADETRTGAQQKAS
jgi:hypothetical protein